MVAAQRRESWPQISQPGGPVLDRTREGSTGGGGGGWVKDAGRESDWEKE